MALGAGLQSRLCAVGGQQEQAQAAQVSSSPAPCRPGPGGWPQLLPPDTTMLLGQMRPLEQAAFMRGEAVGALLRQIPLVPCGLPGHGCDAEGCEGHSLPS